MSPERKSRPGGGGSDLLAKADRGDHSADSPWSQRSLAFHVRTFVPDCADGEEMEHRQALLKARDFAAAQRGKVFSDFANHLSCEAHELAGAFVYAGVPNARLKLAVDLCRHLVSAAYIAEHLAEGGA